MALPNDGKPEGELGQAVVRNQRGRILLLILRIVAFLATVSATMILSLNKETKTLVVAVLGGTPINATITVKFQQTSAFVFFVIANTYASFHNLFMILLENCKLKFNRRVLHLVLVAVLDMLVVAVASSADGAATFMGELGRHGNSHARWNKICDKVETFCNRGRWAIISSGFGLFLMTLISVMSILRLVKVQPANHRTTIP